MKFNCCNLRRFLPFVLMGAALTLGLGIAFAQSGSSNRSSEDSVQPSSSQPPESNQSSDTARPRVVKSPVQWRQQLTQLQYKVTREEGTEPAFTGKYWDNKKPGIYTCVCCGQQLFDANTKFKSGTGWPSYYQPVDKTKVTEVTDRAWGMSRTEVECSRCAAHLGHVFKDGPRPTGLRYCINSASLNFAEAKSPESAAQPAASDSTETTTEVPHPGGSAAKEIQGSSSKGASGSSGKPDGQQ